LTSLSYRLSYCLFKDKLHNVKLNEISVIIVFDDFTEIEKAHRIATWRDVARRIAHEVMNPLTPIILSAQRLKKRYSYKIRDSVFDECINKKFFDDLLF